MRKRQYESRIHGWLIDYEYELDQGPYRRLKERDNVSCRGVLSRNPIVVHVEIENMLDRISNRHVSTSEAVEEIIKQYE